MLKTHAEGPVPHAGVRTRIPGTLIVTTEDPGNSCCWNVGREQGLHTASPELLEILSNAQEFLSTTFADSTREVYARDWRAFGNWCRDHGLTDLPAQPEVVAWYLTHLR